ncbi:MAG: PKD domain-containing protein, partial [Chitinophagaceae bacterium]
MRLGYNNILSKISGIHLFLILSFNVVNGQAPVANFSGTPLSGCSPLIVVFQDQSTGNPASWNWDFGNGNTSTLQNPTATYFTPGTYTVSLTVTNTSGTNTLTRNQYITVNEPPIVDFNSNTRSGCFPLRVLFNDMSAPGAGNTNVSWQWDLGNGTISTLQNPIAVYSTAGTFTITLRVTNDKGCVKTISRPAYITVTPGVTASFTNSIANVCNPPANISFTNNSNGPPVVSYLWDFGDGNTSTSLSPVHAYLSAGTFTATLITSSTAGCEDTARSTPIIIGGFNTNFNAPVSACINETVSFTNISTPVPVSSSWTFGEGGNASTINTTHSYTTPGTYIIRLYNTYSTCIDSTLQSIIINPRPVADFSAPVTAKCEPPLTVNFQDLSTGGALSWEWHFGDGGISAAQNPSHTYTNYGSYNDTLIVTNTLGCTDTLIRPNYIRIQRATISIPSLPARGCIPFTITPAAVINSVDAVTSYFWDFGDGGTSVAPNPTYTYLTQGTYTVKLFITTSSGCTDSLIIPTAIRVGSKPVADFSASPNPVCARQPVQFTDLSVPADEWAWDFGDGGISLTQHPPHNYNDTGYFDIRLIAFNNGCPDTSIKVRYIYVNPPIARFTTTPDCSNRLRFTFTDQSVAPLTWEWNFGDASPLVFTQNPVHNFPSLGTYNVRLVVTNAGCADTTFFTVNTVNENPDFIADITAACKIATIQFQTTNIIPANIVNYDWDFGNGGTASVGVPNVGFAYPTTGNFTVRLRVTDINGCTNTVTKTNYIRINGPLAFFNANNTAGCTGLTTSFTDLSATDG